MRTDGLVIRRVALRQVMKLARTNLRDPDIHWSVPVGQERNEMPVARDGRSLLGTTEIGDGLKFGVLDRVMPEVLSPHNPEPCPNGQHQRQRLVAAECASILISEQRSLGTSTDPDRRCIFLCFSKIAAARPLRPAPPARRKQSPRFSCRCRWTGIPSRFSQRCTVVTSRFR